LIGEIISGKDKEGRGRGLLLATLAGVLRNIKKCNGIMLLLHNEELYALCFSPHIFRVMKSRRMRWAWQASRMGEGRSKFRVLMGKPEGRRHLERSRCKWKYNIKMDP
jgi:hypothetical protein